jgi:uncharacterized membrane protein YphA (DoxX/SURF4 family)
MEPQTPRPEIPESPRWSLAHRIAFRFVVSYFVLYLVPAALPFTGFLIRPHEAFWTPIVTWLAHHVFHTSYEIYSIGGAAEISNTAYGSILFLCYVALAAVATLVWSALDRRRANYTRLHAWLRLLLRYSLATAMISYGTLKVIPTQMPSPLPLGLLRQRIGDLPPMRLLWMFVGSSPPYEMFTGAAELLGGVLLLVPRTVLLGSLVCFADMTMVFVLNMCFDVHVKLFSFHLLFMAALLIVPDLARLTRLFLLNRPVEPAAPTPLFARKWLDRAPHILLFLYGVYTIGTGFRTAYQRYKSFHPPPPPLYGVWSVREFSLDGKVIPPLTDPQRWKWLTFQYAKVLSVELAIGSDQRYAIDLDTAKKRMILARTRWDPEKGVVKDAAGNPVKEPGWQAELAFARPAPDDLVLDGIVDGHRLHAKATKIAQLRDNFRWIIVLPKEDR